MGRYIGKYFIDQRTEGAAKAIRYMKELGLITSESDVSEEDMALINQQNWPTTFGPKYDVHLNTNGYKVRALLVRDKMKELKLIE